ncbi:hypothetical protein CPSG_08720 [Coccidioides posadasii str. Silveira]|uniref:Uncharacterized protein n=1 Tax=Coccidioides posadasii (strain RMSCC 757 / Silveira) TaxID=443226 RepID=E9DFX1_COCPS|nr:hypothetical protein CPSG_08720 [Coccidioides posadasii str. Silveira]
MQLHQQSLASMQSTSKLFQIFSSLSFFFASSSHFDRIIIERRHGQITGYHSGSPGIQQDIEPHSCSLHPSRN